MQAHFNVNIWTRNYIHNKVLDVITNPFPKFNGAVVEVWEWISNLIPRFIEHTTCYTCLN